MALDAQGSAAAPFRNYSVLDGLTQSEVYDIEQDRAGYLWFTTARGLNRYDGKDFDQYTIADGLPTNSLTALHVDSNNTLWVGDVKGGITVIQGARIVHDIKPMGDQDQVITAIESVGERIFVVVEGADILESKAQDEGFRFDAIAGSASIGATNLVVSTSAVWVASTTGLYRLVTDSEPRLVLLAESIRHVSIDALGTLWVVDADGQVGTWRNGEFAPYVKIETDEEIIDIVPGHNGRIWVTTMSELFSFRGDGQTSGASNEPVRRYSGLDEITSLFVDRENSLWLSSKSHLIRFLGDRFRHYRLQTTPDSETVWSIAEDHHGRMWFGTQTKLLLRQADGSLLVIGADYGIPAGAVRDIVADGAGNLWVAVMDQMLVQFDIDSMTGRPVEETRKLKIFDIAMASDGAVWFSTFSSGVFRYSPGVGKLTRFETPQQMPVYTLDTASDGSIWYGADQIGLMRIAPTADGTFVQNAIDGSEQMHNLYFDQIRLVDDTTAWIVTEEGGVYLLKNGVFEKFATATPLADQTVYVVEHLDNGSVIVGGEQGLYQFMPGEPGFAHYGQQSGFIGLETNVHATFVDSDNFLWIGTVDGATRMDTSLPMPGDIKPTPTIVRMETQLDRQQILDSREIEPTQLGARVEFAAISLLHPRGMEYSYMLNGVDTDWGPVTNNRSVSYPRIPPGSYEFRVRARYPGGEWSEAYASRGFTVLPFFWQQTWFIGVSIVLVLLIFAAVMAYRTRQMRWLNETLRAQVEERTSSIEKARQNLEISNQKLSKEIEARAESETRFRRAFENAPIGMGLLDAKGRLFDSNPALKSMFWPGADTVPEAYFADSIGDDDRPRFLTQYRNLTAAKIDSFDDKLACVGAHGDELQTVVNLSAVRSDTGDFLYSVLQIQDVTESLKLTIQLEYQASYDELTGLLNRRAFEDQLEIARQRGKDEKPQCYLMYMDLDQFKVVNDTSGHTAGDQLLRAVSEILLDCVRANDIVARLGGDEFGIILWKCPTDVAAKIAENIRAKLESFRFPWDAETYHIGVSIGGVPIDPEIGDSNELQQLADAACYAAKEAGRNRVHMIEGDKDSARIHRGQVRWVQRLREAMDNNRFAIYAQKIIPLADDVDEPEKLEILLRLRDPATRRLIPPGAFLPAAERFGLSFELDRWVVESVLDLLFIHHSFEAEHRCYWINLSGASIGDKRFAKFLTDAIERSPLPPGTINFEITETAVIRSISEASNLMGALREMGCKFALDDFGSGLSSFGYLKKLPVDYLKIDGMFIRDLQRDETDRIFVKSIIDIAHALNIKTIAEFIENEELLQIVRDLGADYAQGFALGRPYELAPRFPRSESAGDEPVDLQKMAG